MSYRGKKLYTRKRTYGRATGGGILSVQHDVKQSYAKKSMPSAKRQAWKNFTAKVQAVNLKDRGLITALFNRTVVSDPAISAGKQCFVACHLYGYYGQPDPAFNDEAGCNDLSTMVNNNINLRGQIFVNNATGTAPNLQNQFPDAKIHTEKIMFESAVLDMTIFNPTVEVLEVDIYTIHFNKFNICEDQSLLPSFRTGDIADTGNVQFGDLLASVFPQITLETRGATPFEMGTILSRHGIRIMKKEKTYVAPNQAINKQFRDSKNRYFDPRGINPVIFTSARSVGTYKYKDYTKTYLVVAKTVNPSSAIKAELKMGVTRTYKYTYEGLKANQNYSANF